MTLTKQVKWSKFTSIYFIPRISDYSLKDRYNLWYTRKELNRMVSFNLEQCYRDYDNIVFHYYHSYPLNKSIDMIRIQYLNKLGIYR